MKMDKIVYQLTIEDIQAVSEQEINRQLSQIEIDSVKDGIAENINWYDAIAGSIQKNMGDEYNRSN